jgi:hypothetical protein
VKGMVTVAETTVFPAARQLRMCPRWPTLVDMPASKVSCSANWDVAMP